MENMHIDVRVERVHTHGCEARIGSRGKRKKKKEVNNYLLESFLNLFLRTLVLECFQFCN